jgi:hypothetical protein
MYVFGPGDDVPAWAADKITNPNAWEDQPAKSAAPSAAKAPARRRTPKE